MSVVGADQLPERDPAAVLGPRYQLLDELGRGANSQVFRVRDLQEGGFWAAKIMDLRAAPATHRAQALREAQIIGQLDHPHLIRLHDSGEHEGYTWLILTLATQGTLQQRLDPDGRLAPVEAVRLTLEVLEGLSVLHARGGVHRDIKPQNVLIGEHGAFLGDFGVSRLPGIGTLTHGGGVVGTVGYMAPEQQRDARDTTAASDIYAVGAMMYTMLSGRSPLHLDLAPATSPRWLVLPPELRPLIVAACAADPQQRPANAQIFARSLRAATSPPPPQTRTAPVPKPGPGWPGASLQSSDPLADNLPIPTDTPEPPERPPWRVRWDDVAVGVFFGIALIAASILVLWRLG